MANIAIFKPNEIPVYLQSVNTPDYSADPNVLINPDISAVLNVERKFWKRVGNSVAEMNPAEKQAVLDAETTLKDTQAQTLQVDALVLAKALVRLNLATKAALVQAIKEVLLNG